MVTEKRKSDWPVNTFGRHSALTSGAGVQALPPAAKYVYDAVDSGVGADAERQRKRRNEGKSRTLEQYPESEANVLS
jgi:hypothetical protein